MPELRIDRIRLFAVRAVPEQVPESSLGRMQARNGMLIEVTTQEGATGWGEVWCNFPPRGNISRLNLFADLMVPEVLHQAYPDYAAARRGLEKRLQGMAIHTGEPGAFWQCVAGLDMALADASARLDGKALCEFIGTGSAEAVQVYASTPNLSCLEQGLGALKEDGHNAFKLKLGFGREQDLASLKRFRTFAPDAQLMVDANQSWASDEALRKIESIEQYGISFVEEPLLATAPSQDWAGLAARTSIPLAAGENITSLEMFEKYLACHGLSVVQPDVAKWGGVSGAMEVAELARKAGATCALHYMGTAVGLATSIHVMAATGGVGPVELDANPNPLRTELGALDLSVNSGRIRVPAGPGIGFTPDPDALRRFSVAEFATR